MGHSYIEFDGQSVQFPDIDVVLWIRCILAEDRYTKKPSRVSANLQAMFEYWRSPEAFPGPGCFNLRLDDYVADQKILDELLSIMKRVSERISMYGKVVPGSYLNQVSEPPGYDFLDQNSERMVDVAARFRRLLDRETGPK